MEWNINVLIKFLVVLADSIFLAKLTCLKEWTIVARWIAFTNKVFQGFYKFTLSDFNCLALLITSP